MHAIAQKYGSHVNPAFVKLLGALGAGRVYTRAAGTKLWDTEGQEYLDAISASGTTNLGHNHAALLEALRAFADAANAPPTHGRVGIGAVTADLASELARRAAPLTRCLFSTTGSEAVESALKLARAATRRKPIVYCKGGFHGTGLGGLSVMGHGRLRDPFEPLLPQCFETAFDDLPALDRALTQHKPAAFIVEPIQAEGGVVVPRRDYLAEAQDLCRKHGTLFLLDDTRTGLGRTGYLFSHQAETSFLPDVLVLGESLGGGLAPVAVTLTTPEIHDRAYGRIDRYDLHGSTFAGWALGCHLALATLGCIDADGLVEASRTRGERLVDRLRDDLANHPFVRGVSGRGLLVGLELGPALPRSTGLLGRLLPGLVDLVSKRVFGQWLAIRLLDHGILCQPAALQWNVLKIEPPLTISEPEVDQIADSIVAVLGEYTELRPLLTDVGQRLGTQLLSGWSF